MLEVCSDMLAMQGYKEPVSSPPWLKASEPQHIDKPTLTQTQGTTCEQHMEGGGGWDYFPHSTLAQFIPI